MRSVSTGQITSDVAELFKQQTKIIVMGVLNLTPDSFSDGGRFVDPEKAVAQFQRMEEEGADIIDIGGQSSRPGSEPVTVEEELKRVLPVLEQVTPRCRALISIDTYRAEVAEVTLGRGASLINDITALGAEPVLAQVVAAHGAGLILMHKRGTPAEMQSDTSYHNLIGEISDHLRNAVALAERAGVAPEKIMVDPGIGFGKDVDGNLEIVRSVSRFCELGKPVMIGASRKSFIGKLTGAEVDDRLAGSLAAAVAAVIEGATAVRVHDVAATRQAVDIACRLRRG